MYIKKFILSVGLLFMVQVCLADVDSDLDLTLKGTATVIHVDASAANGGDGVSWATAFNNLQDALAIGISGMEIWVADGTYYPDEGGSQVDNNRLASFTLIDGVSLYGGFNGTETLLSQRDPELNITIFSGDITQDDANLDGNNILEDRLDANGLNSYHIITGSGVDTLTVFSGFTVTAGQADGVVGSDERFGAGMYCGFGFNGPSIRMSTFIGHYAAYDGSATYGCSQDVKDSGFINNYSRNGGAILMRGGYYENVLFQGNTTYGTGGAISKNASPLKIVNSKFIANQAFGNGGAISSVNGVTLENVLFSGNKTNSSGGAISQSNSTSNLTNVTMTGNLAAGSGGAISVSGATFNLRNSVIWNNHDSTADTTASSSIYVNGGTYTQTNSLVQNFGTGGVNNLDEDPLFITNTDPTTAPTLLGNAHLNVGSTAINQGDNSLVTPLITDLDGNTRIQDTTVDMGAYEFSSNTVSVNVTGLGAGSLVLQNNSTDDLTFNNNGTLVFGLPIAYTDEYLVTVFSQPTAPNQECVVSNASGIIDGSNVTVTVVCSTIQYTVGGTLSGLINGTLTLQNNTGNDLQLTSDGTFEFTTPIDDLSNYAVTVKTNPNLPRQTCLITGGNSGQNDGTGQLASNDYTDIVVTCTINQYSVGGTVSGLNNGTLTLQNNTGNDLQLSNNGAFEFTTQLDDLSGYVVTLTNNTSVPQQNCSITGGNSGQNDGTGNLSGSNYTGIFVSCADIHLVDSDAPNGGDGYSWNTAFNNVQDALFNAVTGDSIWVAQGVYYPDVGGGQVNDNRSASFNLRNGVSVYGGFNGTETQLNQRDPETNVTILSGDIGQDDGNLDGNNILEDKFGAVGSNSYQVILGTGVNDNSTRFSGFTITAGKADGGSFLKQSGAGMYCGNGTSGPSISESNFIGNYAFSHGGATYGCSHNVRDSNFINNFSRISGAVNIRGGYYENVLFEGNFAVQKGGAISNSVGTLTLVNSKFISNKANAGGGALHSISAITLKNTVFSGNKSSNSNSDGGGLLLEGALTAYLTNVTMTGNFAPLGGAISMTSSVTLNVRNSIIWNNQGFLGAPSIDLNGGIYNQTNSLVQGFGTTGTGNLDEDPLFILDTDPATAPTNLGDAHLQVISPVVNRGDNSFVTPLITDLDGNTRIQFTTVDMGAYESSSDAYNIIHVNASAAPGGHGWSWASAFNNLQDALARADAGNEIWVAQGVYYPDVGGGQSNNNRNASFNLKNGVSVYGGFDGTETELTQRDHEINVTVLSGDLNQDDVNSDGNNILEIRSDLRGSNSYHIIKGSNVDTSTVFSGFIVTAGQANHIPQVDESKGAGMYCGNDSSGPSINNSTFIANYARDLGGATYGCSQDVRDSDFINNYSGLASDFSGSGGAISSHGGYYENVLFQSNGAHENGGALINTGATLTIVNSKFIANSSKVSDGGALYSSAKIVLENVLFNGNKAVGGFADGGAIYLIGFNTSTFTNVTMTDNSTSGSGGAIYLVQASLNLRNSIIWNNFKAGANTSASSSIFNLANTYTQTNSLVHNFGITGVGNLDEDPLFITNLDTTNTIYPITFGNSRLQFASMAIDAGDNSFVTPLITDLDGNDRIQDTTVDMGAYEFSSNTVSVTVSGLVVGTLVLQNNGADNLTFNIDGTQVFNTPVANTADYLVSVFSQPTSPSQECVVTEPTGTINDSDVIINVNCTTLFNVGVDVSGLADGVTLSVLNNSESLDVTNNDPINFATSFVDGSAYAVSVVTNPSNPNQTCLIISSNASGNIDGIDVVVAIECTTLQYNVTVDVFGLADGATLSVLNNSETLNVTSNGTNYFATVLDDASAYAVSVTSNPSTPNQQCLITSNNASGNIAGVDIEVTIQCTTNQYLIGGMASGLANGNSVALSLGAEDLAVNTNAAFVFINPLIDESDYSVSVTIQPTVPNQTCELINPTGTIAGNDITDMEVNCTTNQYLIGGFVTGLHSGNNLVVQNNNSDNLTITSSGDFDFVTSIDDLQSYNASILNQPNNPIQLCSLSSNIGDVAGANVITVAIICEFGDDLIYVNGFE